MANCGPCSLSAGHHRDVLALGGPLLQNVSFWVLLLFWGDWDSDSWCFCSLLLETEIAGEEEKDVLEIRKHGGKLESDGLGCWISWCGIAWLLLVGLFSAVVSQLKKKKSAIGWGNSEFQGQW